MANIVEYIIQAKDNTKGAFNNVKRNFRSFRSDSGRTTNIVLRNFQRLRSGITRSLSGIGTSLRTVFRALRVPGIGAGIAGGLGAIFGGKAIITAAGNYEQLKLRLEAVSGSAEEAAKRFEELQKFSTRTPLALEDLVKADILLRSVGASGGDALENIAGAAAVFKRSVEDIALVISSLEGETLKRFGIGLKTAGDRFTFTFRTRAGKDLQVFADGIDEARKALLDIFRVKFGGFLGKASNTLFGRLSTLKDNLTSLSATIGDSFLGPLKKGAERLTQLLNDIENSETLKKWLNVIEGSLEGIINPDTRSQTLSLLGKGIVDAFSLGADIAVSRLLAAAPLIGEGIRSGFLGAATAVPGVVKKHGLAAAVPLPFSIPMFVGKFISSQLDSLDRRITKKTTQKQFIENFGTDKEKQELQILEERTGKAFSNMHGKKLSSPEVETFNIVFEKYEEFLDTFDKRLAEGETLAARFKTRGKISDTATALAKMGVGPTSDISVKTISDPTRLTDAEKRFLGLGDQLPLMPPLMRLQRMKMESRIGATSKSKNLLTRDISVGDFFDRIHGIRGNLQPLGASASNPMNVKIINWNESGTIN